MKLLILGTALIAIVHVSGGVVSQIIGAAIFLFACQQSLFRYIERIPYPHLILLVASLQWSVGPSLAYLAGLNHYKYYMRVDSETYFAIVTPCLVAYSVGLLWFSDKETVINVSEIKGYLWWISKRYPMLPLWMLGIGHLAVFVRLMLPGELSFVAYLVSEIRNAALILMVLSPRKDKLLWVGGSFLLFIIEAAATSMFHDIFLWGLIIGVFIANQIKLRPVFRAAGVLAVLSMGFLIQITKHDYRQAIREDENASASLFFDMASDRALSITDTGIDADNHIEGIVTRLNQGWIISALIAHVPLIEPFANGETVRDAVVASLIPRVLMPGKAEAGGGAIFSRFTGIEISSGTSMNISILGEAYVNFGSTWAPFFMALFGLTLATISWVTLRLSFRYPILFALAPMIFVQALKAETDLVTVLNYLTKASLMVGLMTLGFTSAFAGNEYKRRRYR
jgi:hypothetical protein